MSFSSEVKQELCHVAEKRPCCRTAELYGMLLFARIFSAREICFQTEHEEIAVRLSNLLRLVCRIKTDVVFPKAEGGYYSITLSESDSSAVSEHFFYTGSETVLRLNRANFENDCCAAAFLRGAFLAVGVVSNPEREYHLEFSVTRRRLAEDLDALLSEVLDAPKSGTRKGAYLLYYKGSESIEDLLTYMHAPNAALTIMNIKIRKNLRNRVNRATNCETANLSRTLEAVRIQSQAIETIEQHGGLEILPEELKCVAVLRRDNPDASLSELGTMLDEPLSRSGVNHRLKRIIACADALRAGAQKDH